MKNAQEKIQVEAGEAQSAAEAPWYVVLSEHNQERKALFHLEQAKFQVYLPLRPGAKRLVPFLPGYLFARPTPQAQFYLIFSRMGVRGVLSTDRLHPATLEAKYVAAMQSEEHGSGAVHLRKREERKSRFEKGQAVRIVDGGFAGFDAIFEEELDSRRIAILCKFMGRDSRVVLTQDWVAPIPERKRSAG